MNALFKAELLDILRAAESPMSRAQLQDAMQARGVSGSAHRLRSELSLALGTGEIREDRKGWYSFARSAHATAMPRQGGEWHPLRPQRQTVIPVRSGGRLAPDIYADVVGYLGA